MEHRKDEMILLFTDGSAIRNPGPSGWAWVAVREGQRLAYYAGYIPNGTNNRGELTAAINALKFVSGIREQYPNERIVLVSDSRYVIGGLSQCDEWAVEPGKPNSDLWAQAYDALLNVGCPISLKWVRGHTGNKNNELCDRLARNAAKTGEEDQWRLSK